jgi:prepilin-type N-terminal cleavage/methylation domain-containing protein
MQHRLEKGFTLLELLIVIAMIGLLAAVVLASINTSRAKGSNSSIKSSMHTVFNQAEIIFTTSNPNSYGNAFTLGACAQTAGTLFADNTIWSNIQKAQTQSGGTATCASTSSAWAVSVPLKAAEGSNTYWCVDSLGRAKGETAAIVSTVCQ